PAVNGTRKRSLFVVGVHMNCQADLLHIGEALSLGGLLFGLGEGGKQESGEDGNDGDDDEQFDQRKALLHAPTNSRLGFHTTTRKCATKQAAFIHFWGARSNF